MSILDCTEFEAFKRSAAALIPEQAVQERERGDHVGTADACDEAAYVTDVRNALDDVHARLTNLESIASKATT